MIGLVELWHLGSGKWTHQIKEGKNKERILEKGWELFTGLLCVFGRDCGTCSEAMSTDFEPDCIWVRDRCACLFF